MFTLLSGRQLQQGWGSAVAQAMTRPLRVAAVHWLGITCVLVIPVGAAAGKTYLRPHVWLSERPAEPPLLWSLCAGGNPGPWGLALTLPSPDAQCSRRHSRSSRSSSSSTASCSRLPARYPGKGASKPLCLCFWSVSVSLRKQGSFFFSLSYVALICS